MYDDDGVVTVVEDGGGGVVILLLLLVIFVPLFPLFLSLEPVPIVPVGIRFYTAAVSLLLLLPPLLIGLFPLGLFGRLLLLPLFCLAFNI